MKILSTGVRCDACNWEKRGRPILIYKWFGKKCPECGNILMHIKDVVLFTTWLFIIVFILYPWDLAIRLCGLSDEPALLRIRGLDVEVVE